MWHSNYYYWNYILREEFNFPAAKISHEKMYKWMMKRNGDDLKKCVSLLEKSPEAAKIARNFESLIDKADTINHKKMNESK